MGSLLKPRKWMNMHYQASIGRYLYALTFISTNRPQCGLPGNCRVVSRTKIGTQNSKLKLYPRMKKHLIE